MDENEKYDVYARAAQRLAQMQQEKARKLKEQEEAQKAAEAKKNAGPGLLFTGTNRDSIRAKYVAAVLFPVLDEVAPELAKTTDQKKNLLGRMFGGAEEYVKRSEMVEIYKALLNSSRQYFKDKWKLTSREAEIMAVLIGNDTKRHKVMNAIKAMTGYF